MAYSGRNHIYEAVIRRMVAQALEAEEQEFCRLHETDTDESLLSYLRECAACLGHTPWPREITGGRMICQRFENWENAVMLAKLPMPHTPDQASCFDRIRRERLRQQECYRLRRAQKRQHCSDPEPGNH